MFVFWKIHFMPNRLRKNKISLCFLTVLRHRLLSDVFWICNYVHNTMTVWWRETSMRFRLPLSAFLGFGEKSLRSERLPKSKAIWTTLSRGRRVSRDKIHGIFNECLLPRSFIAEASSVKATFYKRVTDPRGRKTIIIERAVSLGWRREKGRKISFPRIIKYRTHTHSLKWFIKNLIFFAQAELLLWLSSSSLSLLVIIILFPSLVKRRCPPRIYSSCWLMDVV